MSRIIAGTAKGREIKVPSSGTRPTSARVRESLFARLEHRGYVSDCAYLDLFGGSGALAFEALSRGASRGVAVDAAASAARIMTENAKRTGLPLTVVNKKAETYLFTHADGPFDVVLIDPPYDMSEEALANVLAALPEHMADDGIVVVERTKRSPEPTWPAELEFDDKRTWGDTRVWTALMREKALN